MSKIEILRTDTNPVKDPYLLSLFSKHSIKVACKAVALLPYCYKPFFKFRSSADLFQLDEHIMHYPIEIIEDYLDLVLWCQPRTIQFFDSKQLYGKWMHALEYTKGKKGPDTLIISPEFNHLEKYKVVAPYVDRFAVKACPSNNVDIAVISGLVYNVFKKWRIPFWVTQWSPPKDISENDAAATLQQTFEIITDICSDSRWFFTANDCDTDDQFGLMGKDSKPKVKVINTLLEICKNASSTA